MTTYTPFRRAARTLMSTTALIGWLGGIGTTSVAVSEGMAQETIKADEIVVKSRRRDELLIDVPQQVTVFTSKQIQDAQITRYQDFANLTPNFQSFENFRRGVFNISVRGIPTVQGGEAPVTILVDGVQTAALDFINQDLFDLESIEILRGPQGAVYGRGAIGGAILISTQEPTDSLEAHGQALYTSEIGEYRLNGSVSAPIVKDIAQIRLSASYTDREGFLDNSLAGGQCDFSEETTLRGRLTIQPTSKFSIDAKAGYLSGDNYASCFTFSTDADPFLGNGDLWPDDLPRDFKQFDDREINDYSVKFDYDTGLGILTSVTSYQRSDSFSPGDVDFGPVIQPVFFENPVVVETWNTDFHFVSDPMGDFSWILGGFFQDRDTENTLRVGFAPLPLMPPFLVDSDQKDISRAWAVYGELTYEPTEKLEISVALRYDEDKRESEDVKVPGSFIEERFTAVQPRGSVKYEWHDNLSTYVSVGRGFRSGGFNSLADTLAVGLTDRLFEKETATNYEVGLKSGLFDGRFQVSAALFQTDFKNQQFFFVDVVNVARVVITFPETRIRGFEFELNGQPIDGLDLQATVGVADGEITEGTPQAPTGSDSPNAHKYTVNLNAQYTFPLNDTFDLRTRFEYERRGPIYYDGANRFRYDSTNFFNAFLALEHENWSIGAFGRNLSDERIPTFFGPDAAGPGFHQFFQNLPRRFGIELRART